MSEQLNRIEEAILKLVEFADETKQTLARIESKLDATFEQAARSAEGITEVSSTLTRHERILEVLSLRSIEHESIIKHI